MSKLLVGSVLLFFSSLGVLFVSGETPRDDKPQPELPADSLPAEIEIDALPIGFEERPVAPANNPTSKPKVDLGRKLFFDPILSENETVACASCHQPEHGFASPDKLAIGLNGSEGKRNAPSLLNRAYGSTFLWDGSAASLEEQALTPISNPDEMGGTVESVIEKLKSNSEYVAAFTAAFGEEDAEASGDFVTSDNLAKAIASFERTLLLGNSRVDRFRAAEYAALSKEARQGLWIFESRGGCWKCHSGPNLTDEDFHNTGVGFGESDRDEGRTLVSKESSDRFKFKTPSLRGVEMTAPYMHDGSIKTLKEVVEFYNKGGAVDDQELDKKMKPLKLSDDEVGFLVEFLKALSN